MAAQDHSTVLEAAERGLMVDTTMIVASDGGGAGNCVVVTTPPMDLLAAIYIQARTANGYWSTASAAAQGAALTVSGLSVVPADSGMANIFVNPYLEGAAPRRSMTIRVACAASGGLIISYVRR